MAGIMGVNNEAKKVFTILRMKDINENGLIEKRSVSNMWQAREGYIESADMNRNGEITVAEAKYYIRNFSSVDKAKKKEVQYAVEDKKELLQILNDQLAHATAFHFSDHTKELIQTINGLAETGFIQEAIIASHEHKQETLTIVEYIKIAAYMKEQNYKDEEVKKLLMEALDMARSMEAPFSRLGNIAKFIGLEMTRKGGEKIDPSVLNDDISASLSVTMMCAVTGMLAAVEKDTPKIRIIMKEISNKALAIRDKDIRDTAIGAVVDAMCEMGMHDDASRLVINIVDLYTRSEAKAKISMSMAAVKKYEKAIALARRIDLSPNRIITICMLAVSLYKAGRAEDAGKLMEETLYDLNRQKKVVKAYPMLFAGITMYCMGYKKTTAKKMIADSADMLRSERRIGAINIEGILAGLTGLKISENMKNEIYDAAGRTKEAR